MCLFLLDLCPNRESLEASGVDPKRVLLGVASNFGARIVGPGHVDHKSMKLISIGEMVTSGTSNISPRLKRIERVWNRAGLTVKASADIHTQVLFLDGD